MNETEIVSAAEARPAKPSARRYYIWQAAMWITMIHVICLGIWAVSGALLGPGFELDNSIDMVTDGYDLTGRVLPVHVGVAHWIVFNSLVWLPGLGFLLSPIAALACYRASMGNRSRGLLLSYWFCAGVPVAVVLTAAAVLNSAGSPVWLTLRYGSVRSMAPADLAELVGQCLPFFLPLPVTILAALLTIERKKLPLDAQTGA
jgi:hypothetical protein